MTTSTYQLPDGTTLNDVRDRDGCPRGHDSQSGRTATYHGDDAGGVLVDSSGKTIRRIEPQAKPATQATPARPRGGAGDSSRWRTLNTFVDVVARHLTPVEVAVWLVLFRDCRGGTVEASQRNLAARSGAGERSVVRAMRRLRAVGLIRMVKASKSKGEASLYSVEASPERCVEAIVRPMPTGATTAPDHGTSDANQPAVTGATVAPV